MGSRGPDEPDLTQVFDALRRGESGAEQQLFALVYDELHRMAHGRMIRESSDHTLQTTALVNEAYLRLSKGETVAWENRKHFFGAAGNAMRQILVDRARKRDAEIHGGKLKRVTLDDETPAGRDSADILALDDGLYREAESLLRHDAEEFLENPEHLSGIRVEFEDPDRIGPYRIIPTRRLSATSPSP